MRLNYKADFVRVGNVEINALSRVTELDSGLVIGPNNHTRRQDGSLDISFSHSSLQAIENQLAVIVPCMNEEHSILKGVLQGIPHHCLTVLVSNSSSRNYEVERTILTDLCIQTQRQGIAIHQQDPFLASAFIAAGMPQIVEDEANSAKRIRNGKGEAMLIGVALAKIAEKQFVGFIDADNFVPGAVNEYCNVFAAGLHHALHGSGCDSTHTDNEPLAMVRIKWKSKPKIVDGKLVPKETGRCSKVVNEWMNRLLTSITSEETEGELIQTANAGEHAMSVDLALRLNFATGYAVEPFQLVNMWEKSGVFLPTPSDKPPRLDVSRSSQTLSFPLSLDRKVKVLQIETLNPHIHDFGKGDDHILKMQAQGLSAIYHSLLTPNSLKVNLHKSVRSAPSSLVGQNDRMDRVTKYPSMGSMDLGVMKEMLKEAGTLVVVKGIRL